MELIKVQEAIEERIDLIAKTRSILRQYSKNKADAIAKYKKALALTIFKLKNGVITEFEGQRIQGLPATVIEKVAPGLCHEELYGAELADNDYKAAITALEALKAELNGLQSINRYSEYSLKESE